MVRFRVVSLALLPAVAALIAGCGSSSSSSKSSASTSSTPAATQTATTATATTPATSTTTSASASVTACKDGIQSLPHLRQSVTERLDRICEQGGHANVEAEREALDEACRELVKASPLPAGSAKSRALAACRRAAPESGK
jgi:hypothetical protein